MYGEFNLSAIIEMIAIEIVWKHAFLNAELSKAKQLKLKLLVDQCYECSEKQHMLRKTESFREPSVPIEKISKASLENPQSKKLSQVLPIFSKRDSSRDNLENQIVFVAHTREIRQSYFRLN